MTVTRNYGPSSEMVGPSASDESRRIVFVGGRAGTEIIDLVGPLQVICLRVRKCLQTKPRISRQSISVEVISASSHDRL